MKHLVFLLIWLLSGAVWSCHPAKVITTPDAQTFRVLFKTGVTPAADLFAPAYKMQQAQPVNRSQNEWLISLHPGTKLLQEAPSFLRQLPSVVSVLETKSTGNSQSQNTGRDKVKIHNY